MERISFANVVLLLFLLEPGCTSTVATSVLRDQLLRYSCQLKGNSSLAEEVALGLKAKYSEGLNLTARIKEYYPPLTPGIDGLIERHDGCKQSDAEVTWCVNLWHPEQQIEACISSNGERNATAAAIQLGLLNSLEPNHTCESGPPLCLNIGKIQPYYDKAIIARRENAPNCTLLRLHELSVDDNNQNEGNQHVTISNPVVYAPYGTSAMLRCTFTEYNSLWLHYTAWDEVDYMCEGQVNPKCDANITRIRGYRSTEQIVCPKSTKTLVTLVIDNVNASDSGNYTCYLDKWFSILRGEVTLNAVLPVYEPELNMNLSINQSNLVVEHGSSFEIQYTVVTGLGASVFWRFPEPLDSMDEGSGENDRYWVVSHSRRLENFKIEHTKLVIVNNMSEILTGVYSLVVNDPGYPGHRVHKLFNVTVTMPRESTVYPISSTTIILQPTSDPVDANPTNIGILIGVCIAILILIVISFILVAMLWCCSRNHLMKRKQVISAANNHQLVQFMEKGSLTKLQSLEFPRSRITKISRLAEGTFGEVYLARAESDTDTACLVAVKKPKFAYSPARDFAHELKVMAGLTPHPNIINLLGCCTDPTEGPTYLILEYASHGSLKQFLQSCLPNCFDQNSTGSSSGYSSAGSSFVSSKAPLSAQSSIISRPPLSAQSSITSRPPLSAQSSITSRPPLSAQSSITSRPPLSAQSSITSRPPLSAQTSIFSNTSFSAYSSTRGSYSPTRSNDACSTPCLEDSPQHQCTCQEQETEREEIFVAVADTLEPTPAHKLLPLNHDYINMPQPLLLDDVQNFALQIASGLEHLKKMKVIHCDLAARNILLTRDHTLKIADFGMSRIHGENDQLHPKHERLPVKWTAPESLENSIHTHYSDIWSFGVVLWEIFTYGDDPYNELDMELNLTNMFTYLKEGNRLLQPPNCPSYFYELLQSCWQLDPTKRPTANELVLSLTSLSSDTSHDQPTLRTTCV